MFYYSLIKTTFVYTHYSNLYLAVPACEAIVISVSAMFMFVLWDYEPRTQVEIVRNKEKLIFLSKKFVATDFGMAFFIEICSAILLNTAFHSTSITPFTANRSNVFL